MKLSDEAWEFLAKQGTISPAEIADLGPEKAAKIMTELGGLLLISRGEPKGEHLDSALVDLYHRVSSVSRGPHPSGEELLDKVFGDAVTTEKLCVLVKICNRYFYLLELVSSYFIAHPELGDQFNPIIQEARRNASDTPEAQATFALLASLTADLLSDAAWIIGELQKYPELNPNVTAGKVVSGDSKFTH